MVGIRVTVSLRLRVGMKLRDSVEFRCNMWPGFRCKSVGIRWRVLTAVGAMGVLVIQGLFVTTIVVGVLVLVGVFLAVAYS